MLSEKFFSPSHNSHKRKLLDGIRNKAQALPIGYKT